MYNYNKGHNLVGTVKMKPISENSRFIYTVSQTDCVIALHFDYALERETMCCFLIFHDTKFPPTKTQYPEVNLRSSQDPTQLA